MLLSFIFDIPIFLPILGILIFWLAAKEKGVRIGWTLVGIVFATVSFFCFLFKQPLLFSLMAAAFLFSILIYRLTKHFAWTFGLFALAIFWIVSGGLYWDLWAEGGNHFMWYSWLDKMGIVQPGFIPIPTYQYPFGFWNLFGIFLFLTYPFIMLGVGKWLKGILFGHIKGQTGLWGLFTNR